MSASTLLFQEIISAAAKTSGTNPVLQFKIPETLQERRIYLYMEQKVSGAGAYRIDSSVELYSGGALVVQLPSSICDFTGQTPTASVPCLINSGGQAVGDSLVLNIAQPFSAVVQAVLQPIRINAKADEVALRINSMNGSVLLGFRAWLGVLSTLY